MLILGTTLESSSEKWKKLEKRLREAEFKEFVYLDEETGTFQPCDTFKHAVLLKELEVNTYPETVQRAKECLTRLLPVLNGLKPAFTIR